MPFLHIAVLALVQGITEFLPISSSGHLVLVPWALGWKDQGLLIDVAVHVGTLGAVMLYFKGDIFDMINGLWRMAKGRGYNDGARLAVYLIVATIPVVIAGFVVNKIFPDGIRSILVIGWATLGFGILLWITDKFGLTLKRIEHLKFFDVIAIGLAQTLALIPGTSRSGITMTAGRLLGMERTDAARFSMLLSIPTIIGAGTLKGYELLKIGDASISASAFIAAALSFVSALVAIFLMMAWLRRATFAPFVIYRAFLGVFLLGVAYGYIG
ncbi:MAG: undecaprenyl-diphosphate phosphatase [Rhodospirillaceae bacterium]|nr:undecaprenyl-diphosphate phosphatase [Rhodospirillaceae bacterium]